MTPTDLMVKSPVNVVAVLDCQAVCMSFENVQLDYAAYDIRVLEVCLVGIL